VLAPARALLGSIIVITKSPDKSDNNPNDAKNPQAKNRPSIRAENQQKQSNVAGNQTKNSEKEPAKKSDAPLVELFRVYHKYSMLPNNLKLSHAPPKSNNNLMSPANLEASRALAPALG
jgi:hypothetical protein